MKENGGIEDAGYCAGFAADWKFGLATLSYALLPEEFGFCTAFMKGDFAAPALKIPGALEAGFCKKGLLEVLALDLMNGFEATTAGASFATGNSG